MYLFDTNILSEVLKKRPSPGLRERLSSLPRREQFTSTICLLEMRFGAMSRPYGESFWKKISESVLSEVTLLPVEEQVALAAGDLWVTLSKRGRGISFPDLLIGATALTHQLTLVTANIKHFQEIQGLKVENWI